MKSRLVALTNRREHYSKLCTQTCWRIWQERADEDSQRDGIAGLSVYGQGQVDFVSPGQRRRQPHIALIQADKIALRSGKQDHRHRAACAPRIVAKIAPMAYLNVSST
jgi:hypothetical protein